MSIDQTETNQEKRPSAEGRPTLLCVDKTITRNAETKVKYLQSEVSGLIYALRQEHRDLDQAILALNNQAGSDHIRIGRLKKRKLYLKDQIAYWESRQIPDLNA